MNDFFTHFDGNVQKFRSANACEIKRQSADIVWKRSSLFLFVVALFTDEIPKQSTNTKFCHCCRNISEKIVRQPVSRRKRTQPELISKHAKSFSIEINSIFLPWCSLQLRLSRSRLNHIYKYTIFVFSSVNKKVDGRFSSSRLHRIPFIGMVSSSSLCHAKRLSEFS